MRQTEAQRSADENENLAIRIFAIHKGLYDACGMLSVAPMEVKEAPDLPSWAVNICLQLRLTILKRLLELKPRGKEVNWRNIGLMVGVLQRQFTFFEARKKDACNPALEDILVSSQHEQLNSLKDTVKNSFDEMLAYSAEIQSEFLTGLQEGYEIFLDTQDQFTGDRGRNTIYFVLLAYWMEIEELRPSFPPKTAFDLYMQIADSLNDPRCERYEWFCDVCNEIGLSVKQRGRPRKAA